MLSPPACVLARHPHNYPPIIECITVQVGPPPFFACIDDMILGGGHHVGVHLCLLALQHEPLQKPVSLLQVLLLQPIVGL